jgi:hypothetical protein
VIFFEIDEAARVVNITAMMHSHDRRARRGPR